MWYLSDERLHDLLWQTNDNVPIFGLDFPYNTVEDTRASIARLEGLGFTEEQLDKMFWGNLAHALGME